MNYPVGTKVRVNYPASEAVHGKVGTVVYAVGLVRNIEFADKKVIQFDHYMLEEVEEVAK